MRAVRVHRFGGPEVLVVEEIADPVPGPGQVLVRVLAAGVNPAETYVRSGAYPELPALPYTPGGDAAGLVVAAGPATEPQSSPHPLPEPGARVYTTDTLSGAYAELALCAADQVHPLPEGLAFTQGAAVATPYTTAYRALFQRARARRGQTLLVHGASGAVGVAAVQLAVQAGLTVLATAGSDEGRALALEQGAVAAFDHHDGGHLEALVRQTPGGRGVDLIVELLANVNLGRDLPALAPHGRVVVVGSRGRVEIDARDLMNSEGAILGMRLPNARADELSEARAAVHAGLEAGWLRPVVGTQMPIEQAPAAHRAVIEGPALGKLVLVP
jgi:NADPH2:quinone reductase